MLSSTQLESSVYNGLPHVDNQTPPDHHTLEAVGELFVKHGVHASYGVALLHKHFTLQPCEVMMHHDLVCSPKLVQPQDIVQLSGQSFFQFGDRLQAYEYDETATHNADFPEAFVTAFQQHLTHHGLGQTLALTRIDPEAKPLMEHCEPGRAHVCNLAEEMILPNEATEWRFKIEDGYPVPVITRGCKRDKKGRHK